MLNAQIDSLTTKIYAIHKDLSYKEVQSIQEGFEKRPKPLFVIRKTNIGRTYSLFSKEFFAHSAYSIFNQHLKRTKINESDWVLLSIEESQNRSREVIYRISDPEGEVRSVSNLSLESDNWTKFFQIEGICNIISFLRDLSQYPDWSYYDLNEENRKLRQKIYKLELKIKKLQQENN